MASGSGSGSSGVLILFVHTTLDTHLVVAAPPDRTLAALRSAVAGEHLLCFPKIGPVVVEGFLTTRRGIEFRLSDSLLLSDVVKRGDGECEEPCLVRALAAVAPPDRTHIHDPASKVIQATATQEKKKRRRLPEDLSSPTTDTMLEIVPLEKKKKRSKGVSSDFQAEIQPPIKCKPQGEDQNQVVQEEDLKIVEKPVDKSTNNPEEGTMKKKKKGKNGTSKIATKDGASAEGDSKLSGSCDYKNSVPCKQLVTPGRKKLLVLDINGLLADIIKPDDLHRHNADFKISGKLGFKRPFCDDFLNFCFENFEVGVWSSRMRHNLNAAVNNIFGGMRKKLLFCWDQSKCTTTTFETLDNRPLFLKDLNKLWGKVEPGLPWMGQFTPTNTLLIDDTPCKASLNPPYTAIFPYPYKFSNYEDNALGPGGYIRVYLEKIAAAKDVPKFLKKNPFGLATMETHPEWKHYVTIRDALKGA